MIWNQLSYLAGNKNNTDEDLNYSSQNDNNSISNSNNNSPENNRINNGSNRNYVNNANRRRTANWFSVYIEESNQKEYKLNYEQLNIDIDCVRNQLNQQYLNNIYSQDDSQEYIFPHLIRVGEENKEEKSTLNTILDIFIALELCHYDRKLKRFYDYFH